MSFKFWKKSEADDVTNPAAPAPRRFVVPEEKTEEIYRLWDAYRNADAEKESARTERYQVWSAIAEIFPEVRTGSWSFTTDNVFTIVVIEDVGD